MRTAFKSSVLAALLVTAVAVTGSSVGQDKKDKDKKDTGVVHFEVYKDKGDEFRFRLKEGDTILAIAPHGFKTKEDVAKVIEAIRKDAAKAKVEDMTKGK